MRVFVTRVCRDAADELNQQIADTLGELIGHAHDLGQSIAADFRQKMIRSRGRR